MTIDVHQFAMHCTQIKWPRTQNEFVYIRPHAAEIAVCLLY